MSTMPALNAALVFLLFIGAFMLLHNNFTITESVQHGGLLVFHVGFRSQVAFARIVKFVKSTLRGQE